MVGLCHMCGCTHMQATICRVQLSARYFIWIHNPQKNTALKQQCRQHLVGGIFIHLFELFVEFDPI